MKSTIIPGSGKFISAIGLGCVTFGREINKRESFKLMDFALENNITFFDTAPSYGGGASEKIVGTWLADRRSVKDAVLVSTKIAPPYEPSIVLKSVDQSLKNLRTDAIDLLYLHSWDSGVTTLKTLKLLNDLVATGKVKAIGTSNFNNKQFEKTLLLQAEYNFLRFCTVQNNNNLAVRDINENWAHTCKKYDTKIVTYSPLGAGFLTGKYKNGIEPGTRFDLIKGHQDVYFNETAARRLNKLHCVAARTGHEPSHLALAWALHRPYVSSVLVGGRSANQLSQALAAFNFFDTDIFSELESE